MSGRIDTFPAFSRLLHWLMAVLVIAMLFIGIGMAASVSTRYNELVAVHRPLGIAILLLVVLRVLNRIISPPPPLPVSLPPLQKFAAGASHILLYALMAAMPLVGWAMLSAARYPIVMFGDMRLPPITPHSLPLAAALRSLHTDLAFLLFATVLLHLGAALYHAWIRRDGVFESMATLK